MEESICDRVEKCKFTLGDEFVQSNESEFCNGTYKNCIGYAFITCSEEHKKWMEKYIASYTPNPEKKERMVVI